MSKWECVKYALARQALARLAVAGTDRDIFSVPLSFAEYMAMANETRERQTNPKQFLFTRYSLI